jgi:hypothetical protein
MMKDEIQTGILNSVNKMWHLFAGVVNLDDDKAPGAVERFLEEKDKIHKFLIEIK